MQNKDVEDIVFKALAEYSNKIPDWLREIWCTEIDTITKEAFTELRLKSLHEANVKRSEHYIENLNKEIFEHQKAIDNLRGYITFLESKVYKLESRLGEHESY